MSKSAPMVEINVYTHMDNYRNYIYDRVKSVLSGAIENDRQFEAAALSLHFELNRTSWADDRILKEEFKLGGKPRLDTFLIRMFEAYSGRSLACADAFVSKEQVGFAKELIHRSVWYYYNLLQEIFSAKHTTLSFPE